MKTKYPVTYEGHPNQPATGDMLVWDGSEWVLKEVTSQRILGRVSSGAGVIEEIQLGTGLTLVDVGGTLQINGHNRLHSITGSSDHSSMTASKLIGRGDSGNGTPQEITVGNNLSLSGTTLNAASSSQADVVIKPKSVSDGKGTHQVHIILNEDHVQPIEVSGDVEIYIDGTYSAIAKTVIITLLQEDEDPLPFDVHDITWKFGDPNGVNEDIPNMCWHQAEVIDQFLTVPEIRYTIGITNVGSTKNDLRISFINC